jgi:hypothetical protein
MKKILYFPVILFLLYGTTTNCAADQNVNASWSAGGQVRLGAGSGFIMFAYTYTGESSSLQSACYVIGGILLVAGGIGLLYSGNSSDDFFSLSLAVNDDYTGINTGIQLTKTF